MELLGRIAFEFEAMRPLLPTYLHLLVSAIFPIYTAAHASLSRPPSAAPRKRKRTATDAEERDEDESQTIESLTPSDAILFPILAGGTLASLYFILKWLQDPAWLNWVLGIYFSQMGLFFAVKFLKDMLSVIRSMFFPHAYSRGGRLWKADQQGHSFKTEDGKSTGSPFPGILGLISLPSPVSRRLWGLRNLLYAKARLSFHVHGFITLKSPLDILDLASLLLACAIVAYHAFVSKPWFLTNFLGFSFSYGSLQFMTPTTAWTGTLVLGALFFYDIYFVFFTPMMVTVATKLDVPIKLLFPRPDGCIFPIGAPEGSPAMEEYLQCLAKKRTMAMLGLGDIVVPGMMLAFALRFDLYLHYLRQGGKLQQVTKDGQTAEASKPTYITATGSWGERFWTSSKLWSKDIKAKQFPKPYLYATIFGYLAGMVMTVVVMQVAQHAQPALLYLVPGVLLSLWGTALAKGDLKALWHYSELPEDQIDKKKAGKQDQKGDTKGAPEGEAGENEESTSNGTIEGKIEADEPAKKPQNESSEMENKEKGDRRLVYFSITVPNRSHKGEMTAGEDEAALESETVKRSFAITGAGTDQIGGDRSKVGMDSLSNGEGERRDDGEPSGKRARRS